MFWLLFAAFVLFLVVQWLRAEKLRSPNCPEYSLFMLLRWPNFVNDWATGGALWFRSTFQVRLPFYGYSMIVTDPKNVEHILDKNFLNYEKGWAFRMFTADLLGDGIFGVDGDTWRYQRKVASHIFKAAELKGFMTKVFVSHGEKFLDILEKKVESEEIFDLQDLFFRYTLDSIGDIAFSLHLGCLEGEENTFASSFDIVQQLINKRMQSFFRGLNRHVRWALPSERVLRRHLDLINEFAYNLIDSRRKEREANSNTNKQRDDILSLFLQYRDEEGRGLSDQELRDVIMSFIIAGRDTTAVNLSWTVLELIQNPSARDKLCSELDATYGAAESPSFYDVTKSLPYLNAVVRESLRLHPPVSRDIKVAVDSDVLPDGTIVNKDTIIIYHPYAMGRLPWLWEEPGRFIPERFTADGNFSSNLSPFKFLAFNAGPRTCLGQNMALTEAKILLAMVLKKYRFELAPGFTPSYKVSLTMPMNAPGLLVRALKR